ncbi:MAG: intradiol ring-cleavage dioxygenase [Kordiimonas sp.]
MKFRFEKMSEPSRRAFAKWLAVGVSICSISVRKAMASGMSQTPEQTEGPFYPTAFPEDIDANLLQINGRASQSEGLPIQIGGRVIDTDGNIVSGATVEIWQCDSFGTYHHSSDTGRMDPNFQGFGRTVTGEDGSYMFQTIKPAAYPGRTPHVHFKVKMPGYRILTTQMYFPDEYAHNMRDGIYRSLSSHQRNQVTADLVSNGEGNKAATHCRFNITLQVLV